MAERNHKLLLLEFDRAVPPPAVESIRADLGEPRAVVRGPRRPLDRAHTSRIDWGDAVQRLVDLLTELGRDEAPVAVSGFAPLSVWALLGAELSRYAQIDSFYELRRDGTPRRRRAVAQAAAARTWFEPAADPAGDPGYAGWVSLAIDVLANGIDARDVAAVVGDGAPRFVRSVSSRPADLSDADIDLIAAEVQAALSTVHRLYPERTGLALFLGAPASVAFAIGQQLNPRVHPRVRLFEFHASDSPRYTLAVETPIRRQPVPRSRPSASVAPGMPPGYFLARPIDTVFFGPPQTFEAGAVHHARTQFPPTPQAFQGLVRTRLLLAADPPVDLRDAGRVESSVGPPGEMPAGWQLLGPHPAEVRSDGGSAVALPWVPVPLYVRRVAGPPERAVALRPVEAREGRALSDLGVDPPGSSGGELDAHAPIALRADDPEADEPWGGYIDAPALERLVRGELPRRRHALPPFVERETRVGLATDAERGTARAGLLYSLQSLRFARGAGFLGRLTTDANSTPRTAALRTGTGRAGKQGRLVSFEGVDAVDPAWLRVLNGDHLPESVGAGDLVWLVLTTPARIAGRYPVIAPLQAGVELRFLASAVGPALVIGGYDMARHQTRPNRLYAPAGSAWLFELCGGTPSSRAAALRSLNGAHCAGDAEERGFGFGHIVIGLPPTTRPAMGARQT